MIPLLLPSCKDSLIRHSMCSSHVHSMVPSSKSTISGVSWYTHLAAFDVVDLFTRKQLLGLPRTLYVHESLPQDYFDAKGKVRWEHVYATNQFISSKYNIITFVPQSLLEQFRCIANMYIKIFYLTND